MLRKEDVRHDNVLFDVWHKTAHVVNNMSIFFGFTIMFRVREISPILEQLVTVAFLTFSNGYRTLIG